MALTQVSSLNFVQTAYERLAYFPLRPELYFNALADVKPTHLTNPGLTVQFDITSDLAAATTPLTETSDVTPVALSDSTTTVTLQEYGNAVQTTARLRAGSLIEVNPVVANVIGFNAGISQDTIARNAVQAGTNVLYASTTQARVNVAATNTITGKLIMQAVAKLRGANVQTFGGLYFAMIHPDVSYDLRLTTGAGGWSDPHVYSDPSGVYNGVIGAFGGARFIEAPRAPLFADASNGSGSTGTVDVYRTLVMGRQAIAMAYSNGGAYSGGAMPTLVDVPVTDALRRFEGIGWKWLGGYSVFRQASLWGIEAASSIGANS